MGHNLVFHPESKIVDEEIWKPGGFRYEASYRVVNNEMARISARCHDIDDEIDCATGEPIGE
jgi:hypothetical protein